MDAIQASSRGQWDSREESGKEAEEENKAVLSPLGARDIGGGTGQGFTQQRETDKQGWCPDDISILVRRDRK